MQLVERGLVPDALVRAAIRQICAARLHEESRGGESAMEQRIRAFLSARRAGPVALETGAANEQHYEVPTDLYLQMLGPRLKYSSAWWPEGVVTLAAAEEAMLERTCAMAQIEDGQTILDLGCGWGSLSRWLCERYPKAHVVAVSNSRTQREYLREQAKRRGFANFEVHTIDANVLEPAQLARFDRVMSIEMFEHLWNHELLLERVERALTPGGKVFLHVFSHARFAYPFEDKGSSDWMARHFFTGGTMPSDDWFERAPGPFRVEEHARIDGTHYERTANAWLSNLDRNAALARPILARTYGEAEAGRWHQRWRVFYMACAEMFGFDEGKEWLVTHVRLSRP